VNCQSVTNAVRLTRALKTTSQVPENEKRVPTYVSYKAGQLSHRLALSKKTGSPEGKNQEKTINYEKTKGQGRP